MNRQLSRILASIVTAALLSLPLAAWAQPKITMNIKAEKEVTVKQKGKNVTKMIPVKGVNPGEVVTYTITYKNEGTEEAKDVVIQDPIPEGCSYLSETAEGKGSDITYSIDKGKTFNKPTVLTYQSTNASGKSEKRVATPDEYTNIRLVVNTVPVGGSGKVSFKVRVK